MSRSDQSSVISHRHIRPCSLFLIHCFIVSLLVTSCASPIITPAPPTTLTITIVADSKTTTLATKALTVRDALSEANITLGQIDKVTPSEFTPLTQDTTITLIRVTEKFDVEEVIVPFEKQTVRNEGLPASESRLLQTGVNGKDEITYRTVFENGVQVSRAIVRRVNVKQPLAEIIMVGAQNTFTAIPITGTLSYLSAGNAWLMRSQVVAANH